MVDVKMYTRDGCRGGREQFSWNQLKDQEFKDREQYLGASMKVGLMAKFGRYYVHDWYAKKRDTASSIEEEKQSVQQYEDELMQEALGLKPKKLLLAKKQLTEEELKEVLKKDAPIRVESSGRDLVGAQKKTITDASGQEVEADVLFADTQIKGLGFAAHRNAKLEQYKADILGTEAKLEGIKGEPIKVEMKEESMMDTDTFRLGGASSSSSGVKKEEVKAEVKVESKAEAAAEVKVEAKAKPESEIKDEPGQASAQKRRAEDDGGQEKKHRKTEKSDKKDKKKQKKAEKKLKKKVKKAAKKEKKAKKKAAKVAASKKAGSASSSSSGSSSS